MITMNKQKKIRDSKIMIILCFSFILPVNLYNGLVANRVWDC